MLPDNLFSLPAPDFVDRCATALHLVGAEFSNEDRDVLVTAIRNGTSRLRIIDALENRAGTIETAAFPPLCTAIRKPPGDFALIETLKRFAPDEDAAFLRYTFSQICDREPTRRERLDFEFGLRRGEIDRGAIIRAIVAIARREGRPALWDSVATPSDDAPAYAEAGCARVLPAGIRHDENGRETLTLVSETPGHGWMIAPDLLRQPLRIVDNRWSIKAGWLISGPKRTLKTGTWRIALDLIQAAEAVIDFDVTANSGLDTLQRLAISGPFCGGFCVEIKPENHLCELRLHARECPAELSWLQPRRITMQHIG